jgi:glutathione S-transferase kappa 1
LTIPGNKPPWTLPAKATYGRFDSDRARHYHDVKEIVTPPFFPILSLLPQRALCYIKSAYPASTYEAVFLTLSRALWTPPNVDLSKPDLFREVLRQSFDADETETIVAAAGEKRWKDALTTNTEKVLKQGAFGAPWFWVRAPSGREEPFFGSDRCVLGLFALAA